MNHNIPLFTEFITDYSNNKKIRRRLGSAPAAAAGRLVQVCLPLIAADHEAGHAQHKQAHGEGAQQHVDRRDQPEGKEVQGPVAVEAVWSVWIIIRLVLFVDPNRTCIQLNSDLDSSNTGATYRL